MASLLLLASVLRVGQTQPSHYVEIQLPPEVKSENFFARYVLAGQDFGGIAQPLSGLSSYVISTTLDGHPAAAIKAILYAPGCAIQTLDIALPSDRNPQYVFQCRPLRDIAITGTVNRIDRLYGSEVILYAKYLGHWMQRFLGIEENLETPISVGSAVSLSPDGAFRLTVPDFAQDSLAASGKFEIWAKNKSTGALEAQIVPLAPQQVKLPIGNLKVLDEYPAGLVFVRCAAHGPSHDRIGFARRPDGYDTCGR
jgi:hypothetical protein